MSSTTPSPTAHTPTLHVATSPQISSGQPAAARQAITAAQRQWAYRQRSKRAVTQAIGEEAQASPVTLLALLGRNLASLDDDTAKSMHSEVESVLSFATRDEQRDS